MRVVGIVVVRRAVVVVLVASGRGRHAACYCRRVHLLSRCASASVRPRTTPARLPQMQMRAFIYPRQASLSIHDGVAPWDSSVR